MPRIQTAVKLGAISAAYMAACLAIAIAVAEGSHFKSAGSVLGAQYSLYLFLVPNALAFTVSAWILRAKWSGLRISQVIAAGLSLAILTFLLLFVLILPLAPFRGIPAVSEIGGRIAMLAPGIFAGQLLRLPTSRNTRAPEPGRETDIAQTI